LTVYLFGSYALIYLREDDGLERVAWNSLQGVPLWAKHILDVSFFFMCFAVRELFVVVHSLFVQEDNEIFDSELAIWRREHPQELTREERQKNVEAALADLKVLEGEPCFKFSQ